jgi:hypothetical protein
MTPIIARANLDVVRDLIRATTEPETALCIETTLVP